jgi:hypothetical protein
MGSPRLLVGRGFVNKDPGTWGCKGGAIEIENSIQLRFCRQAGVCVRGLQEVECGGCLWDEAAPKVHGEKGVGEAGNKLTLPGVNGLFGSIGLVHVWWHKLVLGAGLVHELFEYLRTLIV